MKKIAKIFVLAACAMLFLSAFVAPQQPDLDRDLDAEINELASQLGGVYLLPAEKNAPMAKDVIKKQAYQRPAYQRPEVPELVATTSVPRPLMTRVTRYVKSFFKSQDNDPVVKLVTLDDVVLNKEFKDCVKKYAQESKTKSTSHLLRNVLITGAPGTGRTLLAHGLAAELDCYYAVVNVSSLYHHSFEKAQQCVDHLIEWCASQSKPVALILDDADRVMKHRDEENFTVADYFLSKLTPAHINYWVIAVTLLDTELDEECLSRFPVRFELPLPGLAEREMILKKSIEACFKNQSVDKTLVTRNLFTPELIQDLVQKTEGYSGRYINDLVRAVFYPWGSAKVKSK